MPHFVSRYIKKSGIFTAQNDADLQGIVGGGDGGRGGAYHVNPGIMLLISISGVLHLYDPPQKYGRLPPPLPYPLQVTSRNDFPLLATLLTE